MANMHNLAGRKNEFYKRVSNTIDGQKDNFIQPVATFSEYLNSPFVKLNRPEIS